ncbi:MAG: complex I subunit 1 family protein [Pseudomonadota bacterium]
MITIIIATLVKIVILFAFTIALAAVLTWMERRQSAMMQDRLGPQRANFGNFRLWGLLHPIADSLKLLTKEDHIPLKAHKVLFVLAPLIALLPVFIVMAVIPFGPPVALESLGAMVTTDQLAKATTMNLQIATLDIGLLFVFAIGSLGVYGAVIGGWASRNNYGLLGGMRATAQMLSYEVTMGLAIMGVFLVYGTLEPMALVQKQASIGQWGVVQQPLAFLLFFFAAIAETKRAPFDIPEGESEIVGYFVEYSGVRFMTFYLGEFLEIVFVGCIVATVFFGGWQIPGLHDDGLYLSSAAIAPAWAMPHWMVSLLRVVAFMAKVFVLCFVQLTIRWTVPRMRYDQLMRLGWKGLLPASILNIVVTACIVLWSQAANAVR